MTDEEDIHDIHDSPPSGGKPSAASQSFPSSIHASDDDDVGLGLDAEGPAARVYVKLGTLEVEVEGDDLDDVKDVFDEELATTIDLLNDHHEAIREFSRGYY